ncbi:hypothetical protein BDV18DRAFT_74278 [Aspergillus unguis]
MGSTALVTTCAALDQGGGVRLGQTFAIYSCASLPARVAHLSRNDAVHTELKRHASQICKTLPIYVDASDMAVTELAALPAGPRTHGDSSPSESPATRLPWFLINAATITAHCIVGRTSPVESLLVVLQRPWCVLEICCADTETIFSVRRFALIAAELCPESYTAAARLLSHELRARLLPVFQYDVGSGHGPDRQSVKHPRCAERALCEVYRSTTLVSSYNRFWIPLIACCAVYLDLSIAEVVGNMKNGRVRWIDLYRKLLARIGDWIS